jgi:hypothetical protein
MLIKKSSIASLLIAQHEAMAEKKKNEKSKTKT